jgi:hypothetical protein
MPFLDVDERVMTPRGRIDLAFDVIGVMVHPKGKTSRRRRRTALARTLFGMSDHSDDPEVVAQVEGWWKAAGGFKTDAEADPYSKQQNDVLCQIPKILTVGKALDWVWAMDVHHRDMLPGGGSLHKAFAILQDPVCGFPRSESSLWSAWKRYKPVAHLCAAFMFAFEDARRNGTPDEFDECMKYAYDEAIEETLSLVAAYQRFGTGFMPHGQRKPLIDPEETWLLRGIEAHDSFVPPPLPPELLAVAEAYKAPENNAYR